MNRGNTYQMENGVTVCKKAFMSLLHINKNLMTMCRKHVKGDLLSQTSTFRTLSMKSLQCMTWIEEYASYYGDRMPNNENILLPYRTTKISVYNSYCQDMKECRKNAVSRAGFNRIWKHNFPNLKIKQVFDISF